MSKGICVLGNSGGMLVRYYIRKNGLCCDYFDEEDEYNVFLKNSFKYGTAIFSPIDYDNLTTPNLWSKGADALSNLQSKDVDILIQPNYSYEDIKPSIIKEMREKVKSPNYSNVLFDKNDMPERFRGDNVRILQPLVLYDENGVIEKFTVAPYEQLTELACRKELTFKNTRCELRASSRKIIKSLFPKIKKMARCMYKHKSPNDDFDDFIGIRLTNGKLLVTALGMKPGDITIDDICYIRSWKDNEIIWEGMNLPTTATPLIVELLKHNRSNNVIVSAGYNEMINNYRMRYYTTDKYISCNKWGEYKNIIANDDHKVILQLSNVLIQEQSLQLASLQLDKLFKLNANS